MKLDVVDSRRFCQADTSLDSHNALAVNFANISVMCAVKSKFKHTVSKLTKEDTGTSLGTGTQCKLRRRKENYCVN